MRVRARVNMPGMAIDEVFSGKTAEEVVVALRSFAARKAPFLARPIISSMPPLKLAAEATRLYNQETGKQVPPPASCEAFLAAGVAEGFFEMLDD